MIEGKAKALAIHLVTEENCTIREAVEFIQSLSDEDNINRESCPYVNDCGEREFSVFTDNEADTEYDEYMDNYIDDCILSELPEQYQMYFDDERWKRDNYGNRSEHLNGWDGKEHSYHVDGETFYIYKN